MRAISTIVSVAGLLGACSSSPRNQPIERPRGYAELITEARDHEARAAEQERVAAEVARVGGPESYSCGLDPTLNEQLTSGGEPITQWVPCWDAQEEAEMQHRAVAARERAAAAEDRATAASLARAEARHCRGIPERELDHSPFAHRRAIDEVVPHRDASGALRGVRVLFKRVPGLTGAYLERAIACHQARFAVLGMPPTYLPEDPTLVAGAEITVTERASYIEVLVRSSDDVGAAVALGRARELAPTQTATR